MCNNPTVSIIDDNESVRVATSSLVRSLGWDARLFESAEQFIESGNARDVTCIISDVRMQGMSGIDMYRQLLCRGTCAPIIFISAFASEKVRKQAFDAGAVCVLSKPVDATAVTRCLDSVRTSGSHDAGARPPAGAR